MIFLPLTILVEVDTDLKLPIPLPPNDVEENEVRPPWPREPNEVKPAKKEKVTKCIWPRHAPALKLMDRLMFGTIRPLI